MAVIAQLVQHPTEKPDTTLMLVRVPTVASFFFPTSSYATASVLSLGHYGFRGGASLQIENAQLKLHFSSCMLVLSFE